MKCQTHTISDAKHDSFFQQLDFANLQQPPSPKFSEFHESPFQFVDPMASGFGARTAKKTSDDDHIQFHFSDSNKQLDDIASKTANFEGRDDDFNFFFGDEARPETFRKPIMKKDRTDSLKEAETMCNTKEAIPASLRQDVTSSDAEDTKSEFLSQSAKNSYLDNYSLFQDLCPVKEEKLVPLNSFVSLTLGDKGSSLSVDLCTCNLSNCKMLQNFLQLAEDSQLEELGEVLDSCESELTSKLAQLRSQLE